jgi:hypothetical protein
MIKKEKEELIKKGNASPIWLLEMRISRQNKLLINLVSQGIKSNDSQWRNICYKRNLYRNILLEKLIKWKDKELKDSNPNYSDYLDYENDKKNNIGEGK